MPSDQGDSCSVTAFGAEGEGALVEPATYMLDPHSRPRAAVVQPAAGSTARPEREFEIDFVAGFGEAGPDVPDVLRRAILVLVAHWVRIPGGLRIGESARGRFRTAHDRMIRALAAGPAGDTRRVHRSRGFSQPNYRWQQATPVAPMARAGHAEDWQEVATVVSRGWSGYPCRTGSAPTQRL